MLINVLESKRERDAEFTGETYGSKFDGEYIAWIDKSLYRLKPDATDEEKADLLNPDIENSLIGYIIICNKIMIFNGLLFI